MSSSGIELAAGPRGEEEEEEDSRASRCRVMKAVSCSSSWDASPSDSSENEEERRGGQRRSSVRGGEREVELELTFLPRDHNVVLLLVPSLIRHELTSSEART